MIQVRTNKELIQLPAGTICTLWCGSEAKVIKNQMGQVLIEYLSPGKGDSYRNSKYFIWSSGGGLGMQWGSESEALATFEADCQRTAGFWVRTLGPDSIIVRGEHYRDGGWQSGGSPAHCLGFGGALWIYRSLSDGSLFRTNNLWHQGTIPPEFSRPDTHEFLQTSGNSLAGTGESVDSIPTNSKAGGNAIPSADQDRVIRS